jgi:TetR/AcrR family transcriptional regulator, transcriptional repressor for nem operon
MVAVVADGGIILSKVMQEKEVLPRQVMLYRGFVRMVFLGT